MRKKTKPRVAWLPHTDTATIIFPGNNRGSNVIDFDLDISGGSDPVTGVVPVVIDGQQDPLASTTSLADIEDSGYRLRRIVGKCFASYDQNTDGSPGAILLGAAFIILRISEQNGNVPLAANLDNYNLFDVRQDDSPWIWRREWILSNSTSTANLTSLFDYPHTTAEYGSAVDGPHIDQKTARIVMSDERLFFVATAMPLTGGAEQVENTCRIVLTTRVLASMRTSLGNRRNASR